MDQAIKFHSILLIYINYLKRLHYLFFVNDEL